MPDAFSDIAKVTRSHIPAANVPPRLEIPNTGYGAITGVTTTLSGGVVEAVGPQRKRGRPLGSMDSRPRKKVSLTQPDPFIINTGNPSHEIISDYVHESILGDASMIEPISNNKEISMNYACMLETLERTSIIIDNVFAYSVAQEIIEHDDIEPRSVEVSTKSRLA